MMIFFFQQSGILVVEKVH